MDKEQREKVSKYRRKRAERALEELQTHYGEGAGMDIVESVVKAGVAMNNTYQNVSDKLVVAKSGVQLIRAAKTVSMVLKKRKQAGKINQVLAGRSVTSDSDSDIQDDEITKVYLRELKYQEKFLRESQDSGFDAILGDGLAVVEGMTSLVLAPDSQSMASSATSSLSNIHTLYGSYNKRDKEKAMLRTIGQTLEEIDPPNSNESAVNSSQSKSKEDKEDKESCCSKFCLIL